MLLPAEKTGPVCEEICLEAKNETCVFGRNATEANFCDCMQGYMRNNDR